MKNRNKIFLLILISQLVESNTHWWNLKGLDIIKLCSTVSMTCLFYRYSELTLLRKGCLARLMKSLVTTVMQHQSSASIYDDDCDRESGKTQYWLSVFCTRWFKPIVSTKFPGKRSPLCTMVPYSSLKTACPWATSALIPFNARWSLAVLAELSSNKECFLSYHSST